MRHETLFRIACALTVIFPLLLVSAAASDIALSVIALLFLLRSWTAKEWGWLHERWVQCAGLLWLYMIARGLFAQYPLDALSRGAPFIRYIVFAAALARWTLADDVTRRRFFTVLGGTVVALAADGLLQYVTGYDLVRHGLDPHDDHIRLTGLFNKKILGIMLAWLAFPALLPLAGNTRISFVVKTLCVCIVLTAIAFSGERIALLLTLMGILEVSLLLRLRLRHLLTGIAGICVLLGVLALASPMFFDRQVKSTASTLVHWQKSPYGMLLASDLTLAQEHPVIGLGANHFRPACEALYPDDKKRIAASCNTHPHNIYFEWLIEEGLIGLGFFIAMLVFIGKDCIRAFVVHRGNPAFTGLLVALTLRVWPFMSTTNFFSRWGAPAFWLVLGALLVYTTGKGVKNAGASLSLQDPRF